MDPAPFAVVRISCGLYNRHCSNAAVAFALERCEAHRHTLFAELKSGVHIIAPLALSSQGVLAKHRSELATEWLFRSCCTRCSWAVFALRPWVQSLGTSLGVVQWPLEVMWRWLCHLKLTILSVLPVWPLLESWGQYLSRRFSYSLVTFVSVIVVQVGCCYLGMLDSLLPSTM